MAKILIQTDDFDAAYEARLIFRDRHDIGALVSFVGLCRDDNATLSALELEHYPGMAEDEISRIASEAEIRWQIRGITVIHRIGKIKPGQQIVLVITASSHRSDAFNAADFIMDFLKSRAPFWKKQHFNDGTSGVWVNAKDSDETSLKRW